MLGQLCFCLAACDTTRLPRSQKRNTRLAEAFIECQLGVPGQYPFLEIAVDSQRATQSMPGLALTETTERHAKSAMWHIEQSCGPAEQGPQTQKQVRR